MSQLVPKSVAFPLTNRLRQIPTRNSNGNTLFEAFFDYRPHGLYMDRNLKKNTKTFFTIPYCVDSFIDDLFDRSRTQLVYFTSLFRKDPSHPTLVWTAIDLWVIE